MRILVYCVVLTATWFLAGCATSYQSNSLTGGYSQTQLAPDVFRVSFRGNGYTTPERAQDYALLRASELTLEKGFTCFALVDEKSSTTTQGITTAGSAHTTGTAYQYGNSVSYSGNTTYVPGQTITIRRPTSGVMVRCFKTKPEDIFTFDAAFLQNSLREKYKIKPAAPKPQPK
jgi:hypothetical protein